ncbi:MAG TPA: hypothetical protein VH352_07425 [Pseudonocardiaceae bacterium]|jgi:hypothetical protein|nr:hypothetical protein [Pseudonocardiaceae bacterium]
MFNRLLTRAVTVAALGAATAAIATIPAHAAEGNFLVVSSNRCVAQEIIRLQPVNGQAHDFMLIDPTTNVPSCWFGIWDNNRGRWAYGSESGAESPPIYDGPGESLTGWVATWNGSAWVDWASGPTN